MASNKSLGGVLIKKPHQKHNYTEAQMQEFIKCLDPETGHLYFAKTFYHIQHPVRGKLLFDPFDYQIRLLDSYHNYKLSINMLPRQSGKCLTGDAMITLRNKETGEEIEISIKEFYDMQAQMQQDSR